MIVTATEFKANFGRYLEMIAKEDVFITRNGKTVAKVVNPRISAVDSLRGMLKDISSECDQYTHSIELAYKTIGKFLEIVKGF